MAAALITATVIGVVQIIVVQKAGLSARRARRIIPPTICPFRPRAFGCKLMMATPAEILLISIRVFAIAIKVLIVVALWAAELV